jgi:hypothetical protein
MSVFKIKVIKNYQLELNKLEVGMNVELVCSHPSPTIYHGLYINQAFMKKYGFDLKGHEWNTSEYLEIVELDNSKLENLTKEIELITIEKSDLVIAQRFEDVAMVRDLEKKILEQIETLKLNNMNFKNYEEKQNNLFHKWIEKHPEIENNKFTWDGIVAQSEEEFSFWLNSKAKILFLVKEAHGEYEPSIPTEIEKKFNLNLARWKYLVEGFFTNGEVPNFPSDEILKGKNTGMAIVEVKKYDEGKKISSNEEIMHYAKRDAEFLREQIEIINPTVIICCGTFSSYEDGIYANINDKIAHEYYGVFENIDASIYTHRNRTILNFYHPSYTKSPELLYNLLGQLFINRNEKTKN